MKKIFAGILIICCISVLVSGSIIISAAYDTQPVTKELYVYDEQGNEIIDEGMIDNVINGVIINSRIEYCCSPSTMNTVVTYYEEHSYTPPLPAFCMYDRYRVIVCTYCGAVHSRTFQATYVHMHGQ